jgi:hypothetical protein
LSLDRILDSLDFKPGIIYLHVDKSIWNDYPNKKSWDKRRKAKKEGLVSENEKIGGEIGIHGVSKGTVVII